MKVLHVASFIGNIGDNASHLGFYRLLREFIPVTELETIEIRKFYKNYDKADKRSFDQAFIDYANSFDLLIIGGGGFLDYWVENSASGTTIDMEPALLARIKTPTLITSVGCKPHKDVPSGNIEKFQNFLDAAIENPKVQIAVRTDGSIDAIRKDIGAKYLSHIPEVLDSGFFYQPDEMNHLFDQSKPYIAINITDDQIRMVNSEVGEIDPERYYSEFARAAESLIQQTGYDLVFVPHIYSDLQAISTLLSQMDNWLVRQKASAAPCMQYSHGAHSAFNTYKRSELVIGTRYHANVCSLAMGANCMGLAALDRVKYVYEMLGASKQYCELAGEFSASLTNKALACISESTLYRENAQTVLQDKKRQTMDAYHNIFGELLS